MKFPARIRAAVDALFGKQALSSVPRARSGYWGLFGNDRNFQTDIDVKTDTVLTFSTVFACTTLIASDVSKVSLGLMEWSEQFGIWVPKRNAAYSPVLRRPNHFQTRQQFVESWLLSKLTTGNAYILKQRDARRVVVAMYVLDPTRVTPKVAPSGEVFYQVNSDDLSKVPFDIEAVPASEVIHDRFNCLFHPLVGHSPIFASGLAAMRGLKIESNSTTLFGNMSRPSGILTGPGEISDETAQRIKDQWQKNYTEDNFGKVAVLGDDLKYQAMTISAVDAQMVELLDMSAKQICAAFLVPGFMVGVGDEQFPNASPEAGFQRYYAQCLQRLFEAVEACLDEGLGLDPLMHRTEFSLDDLLRMDTKTLAEVEGILVQRGIRSPNESRRKFNNPPAEGGNTPYLQQQNFSLSALARRDAQEDPFATSTPAPAAVPEPEEPDEETRAAVVHRRAQIGLFGAVVR